jgi:hypothetical protein
LRVHTDWRTSWTHIVGGKFSDAHDDGVLFYEGSTGFAEIYDTDGHGNLWLLRQHQDLGRIGSRSHRWTQIIVGRFSSSQNSSLLLVDANSSFAAIFNVDATGNLIKLRDFANWGTWTHVTIVRIVGSDFSAVLRYNQATGRGEILECDGNAGLQLRQASDGWRKSWSHVVGGFAAAPRCCSMSSRPVNARSISSPTTRKTRKRMSTRSEKWCRSSWCPEHQSSSAAASDSMPGTACTTPKREVPRCWINGKKASSSRETLLDVCTSVYWRSGTIAARKAKKGLPNIGLNIH